MLLPAVATGQKFGRRISGRSAKGGTALYTVLGTVHVFQEKMQSSVEESLLVFLLIRGCNYTSDREPITHLV